jgi:thiol-disulfide isomerase/thioredoxin
MLMRTENPPPRKRWMALFATGMVVAAAIAIVAVYGFGGSGRNPDEAACRSAVDTARRLAPLARGEVAAVSVASEARRVPQLAFKDATGADKSLADWHGRLVLLNLWATWCVPCRKEMPALDALEEKLGGPNFAVVAVNIDTRDLDKPKKWLSDAGITRLAYFADPSAKMFQDLKSAGRAVGMPTTLLVDPAGCELASLAGPAEWASEDALALIRTALRR